MPGASFSTPSEPSTQVQARWLLCHPLLPLSLPWQLRSPLEQLSVGKTARPRPMSSSRYICRVSGVISPSVLSYSIRKPSSRSCPAGSLCWQVYGEPPSVTLCSLQKRSTPSTLRPRHHDLFKARTDGSGSVEKGQGRRVAGSLSGSLVLWQDTQDSQTHTHLWPALNWFTASDSSAEPAFSQPSPLIHMMLLCFFAHHKATRLIFSSCSEGRAFLYLVLGDFFTSIWEV